MTLPFPIDILSPPAFLSLLETSGPPDSAAAAQTGGQAGLLREEGLGHTESSHSCPLPQASPIAPAWSPQWGPSPTPAKGPTEVSSQLSEAPYFLTPPKSEATGYVTLQYPWP